MKVRAYIKRHEDGRCVVYCRRDRFKHLFPLGVHKETDRMFMDALKAGEVDWQPKITDLSKGRIFHG